MNASTALRNSSEPALADHKPVHSDGERARALVQHLNASGQRSTAEILFELRQAFPRSPLSVRIAALAALSARHTR